MLVTVFTVRVGEQSFIVLTYLLTYIMLVFFIYIFFLGLVYRPYMVAQNDVEIACVAFGVKMPRRKT